MVLEVRDLSSRIFNESVVLGLRGGSSQNVVIKIGMISWESIDEHLLSTSH